MAKRISDGLIKEALQKLGSESGDDIAKAVNNIADSAQKLDNPRKGFTKMIEEFGGIKKGDGFTMRKTSPWASDAPVFGGDQNFVLKRRVPRGSNDGVPNAGHGPYSSDNIDGKFNAPAVVSNGPTAEDLGRQASERQRTYRDRYNENLGRNGRREDGSKMGWFERRNAKKHWENVDYMRNADSVASNPDMDVAQGVLNNSESDGISGFAKGAGLVVAGGIAGAVLSKDD